MSSEPGVQERIDQLTARLRAVNNRRQQELARATARLHALPSVTDLVSTFLEANGVDPQKFQEQSALAERQRLEKEALRAGGGLRDRLTVAQVLAPYVQEYAHHNQPHKVRKLRAQVETICAMVLELETGERRALGEWLLRDVSTGRLEKTTLSRSHVNLLYAAVVWVESHPGYYTVDPRPRIKEALEVQRAELFELVKVAASLGRYASLGKKILVQQSQNARKAVIVRRENAAADNQYLDEAVRECRKQHPTWARRAIAANLVASFGRSFDPVDAADRTKAINALARKIERRKKIV